MGLSMVAFASAEDLLGWVSLNMAIPVEGGNGAKCKGWVREVICKCSHELWGIGGLLWR